MGIFNHFPYTNIHELNLDWLLGKTKENENAVASLGEDLEGLDARVDYLEQQEVTKNYVDGADASTLDSAKAYADNKDVTTLDSAKNYADTKSTAAVNTARAYTDTAVPNGGAAKQVLTKASNGNKDTEWDYPLPEGGETGMSLVKRSGTNQDVQWSWGSQLPGGGTLGQVLAKNSGTPYDVGWASITAEGPVPVARLIPQGGATGQALIKTSGNDYAVGWAEVASKAVPLWTNASPTSAFANQSINLDLADYSFVIICANSTIQPIRGQCNSIIVPVSDADNYFMLTTTDSRMVTRTGNVNRQSVMFQQAVLYQTYGQSGSEFNTYLVPSQIYGIK